MTLTIRLGGWWRLWIAPVLLCMLIAYNSAFAATLAERASASGCLTAPEVVEGETYRCMTATGAVYFSVPGTPPKTSPPPAQVPPASAGGDRWAALATDTANSVISVDRLSIAPAGTAGHRKGWFKTDYLAGAPYTRRRVRGKLSRTNSLSMRTASDVEWQQSNTSATTRMVRYWRVMFYLIALP